MAIVLCVRVSPADVPEAAKLQFGEHFGDDVVYQDVNPKTPEELDALTKSDGVVAVYLQERPLPAIVLAKGQIPCTLLDTEGKLIRLKSITPEFGPID